jgi:hypothetical protein
MRSTARFTAAIALLGLTSTTAFAQEIPFFSVSWRKDLSGTWRAPGGEVNLTETDDGWQADRYAMTGAIEGQGVFDGSTFLLTTKDDIGIVRRIENPEGGEAPSQRVLFFYEDGDQYDWLVTTRVRLYRAHKSDGNLNGPWSSPETPSVTSERISGLYDNLRDVTGNDDRIANDGPASSLPDDQKLAQAMKFLADKEAAWGTPVTDLAASDFPSQALYDFFRAEKAIELTRYGRTPAEVKDAFLNVTGSVEGTTISARKIFCQLWPSKTGTATVIGAVIPGYRDTGRTFYDQIKLANDAGADMVAMDAQWSGWTQGGHSGGVDSGQGIARDAYAFASWVQKTYSDRKLFIMGSSLGGGPGGYGTLTLAGQGQIDVTINDGKNVLAGHDLLPASTPLLLQAPFLKATSNFTDWYQEVAGEIPILKTYKFHFESSGKNDGDRADDVKTLLTREDGTASQAEAMDATLRFGKEIVEKIHMGLGPTGPVYVIHAKDDVLADYKTSAGVVSDLQDQGKCAELTTLNSNHHTFWNEPTEQSAFLPYLAKIQGR